MEEPNNYDNFDELYKETVKKDLKTGVYFKEAFDWYSTMYLRTIVNRTFFMFMSIMGVIIIYFVTTIIMSILPLKENVFITIKEQDMTKYWLNIQDISKSEGSSSTDEAVLEYLVKNYVTERESHDYRRGDMNEVRKRIEHIRNTSSGNIFNEFNYFMSTENSTSPIHFFQKNAFITIEITGFNFIKIQQKFIDKVLNYFKVDLLPTEAEVYYTVHTNIGGSVQTEKRKVDVSFQYNTIEQNKTTGQYSPISFIVTGYKNYTLK